MAGDTRSGQANLIDSIIGGVESFLPSNSQVNTKQSGSSLTTSFQDTITSGSEQLILDPAAITRIIEEVLSGPEGLASIFAGEQTAGIFDSSVAAQAAGNLTAKLVGELAKITGETVTSGTSNTVAEQRTEQEAFSSAETKDKGILGNLGDLVGL
jgi:hypothetical protein